MVSLKLALLVNGLRRSSGRKAAYVVSAVVVVLFAVLQLIGLIALRGVSGAGSLALLLAMLLALGWAVLPLFFPSGDETLDPGRLVMLPLRPQPLVRALLVASLVGIGPLFALCLAAGAAVTVAHGAAAAVLAVPAVAVLLLSCVALSRSVAVANIRLLSSRRGKDLAVLSGLVIAVGAQVLNFGAQRLGSAGLGRLDPVADVIRWLPPASALGSVDAFSDGSYGAGTAQFLLAVALLVALLGYWRRGLTRLMTAPDGSTLQTAEGARGRGGRSGAGLARLLPPGRVGASMERALRYVWRDPKTKAAWVTALAIGLIVPVLNAVQNSSSPYLACFAAGMLGAQMYNQFGQDTSAFWMIAMTVSSPRDAYLELLGRASATVLVTLPYATLVTVLTTGLLGDLGALPEVLGLSYALLGALVATGACASARVPYAMPQSGYKNVAPGQGMLAAVSIFGGMFASAVLCAPLIAGTIWLHASSGTRLTWLLLPVGACYGALCGWGGLRVAARWTAQRLPEILTAVTR
ncbi:transporter [Streptomyces sp. NPDC050560]|uniref:transporter n=1 Tax=Streptomyces sp. NPDC050560 TaxID=3365630 RepID=UPI00378A4094